jgi:hypothetical protein
LAGEVNNAKTRNEEAKLRTPTKANEVPSFNNLKSMADYLGVGTFDPKTAGFYEYSDAKEYFYNTPEYLYNNLFVLTPRPVYNKKNPIPCLGKPSLVITLFIKVRMADRPYHNSFFM